MTTKKIVITIASLLIGAGILIGLFVGGIVGFALYSVSHSEAATTAKAFLSNNEKLVQDIGAVREFGYLVTGGVSINNGDGQATLKLKVIGARKTVNANVELMYRSGKNWRVTSASYTNEAGQVISLFNPYDSNLRSQILRLQTAIGKAAVWHE